ncbi:MAG: hypothetical protein GXY83_19650 [Rhodopirellula sp.]|nr:hypothetical protein [Rhodopirellula sp.]
MEDLKNTQIRVLVDDDEPNISAYVVLLNGYPTIDVLDSAIEDGARRLLSKPVNPEELVGVLETQLV